MFFEKVIWKDNQGDVLFITGLGVMSPFVI